MSGLLGRLLCKVGLHSVERHAWDHYDAWMTCRRPGCPWDKEIA